MQYNQNSVYNPSFFSKRGSQCNPQPSACELVKLFNQSFARNSTARTCVNTYLIAQASEPVYLPAHADPCEYFGDNVDGIVQLPSLTTKLQWLSGQPLSSLPLGNKIFFNRDYVASALHEAAHWCIAGSARREQVDYGYWYAPDGRNSQQQRMFEKVEVKPQAIEWAFSMACNASFSISNDNLLLTEHDSSVFEHAVKKQLLCYVKQGFPASAQQFLSVLRQYFGTPDISHYVHPSMQVGT